MTEQIDFSPAPLLDSGTLAHGAAIAALPEPLRQLTLGSLLVRASDGADAIVEDFDASDRAAELYLAAVAAIEQLDPLEVLRGDPFEPSNQCPHSTQFNRLMCAHHYRAFVAEHPADLPLDTAQGIGFVGLLLGSGKPSWHAPGDSAAAVVALAAEHAHEGQDLVALWDLRAGEPAACDFVVSLTVHVQAHSAEQAYDHVVELIADMDEEVLADAGHVPGVHHLHAAGPFIGVARSDAESVDSIPHLWRTETDAEPLQAVTGCSYVDLPRATRTQPRAPFSAEDLALVVEALDSHLYWQVCQDHERRRDGAVVSPLTQEEHAVVALADRVRLAVLT